MGRGSDEGGGLVPDLRQKIIWVFKICFFHNLIGSLGNKALFSNNLYFLPISLAKAVRKYGLDT